MGDRARYVWASNDRLARSHVSRLEQTAIELVRQSASSPALIIDMRGNGGWHNASTTDGGVDESPGERVAANATAAA